MFLYFFFNATDRHFRVVPPRVQMHYSNFFYKVNRRLPVHLDSFTHVGGVSNEVGRVWKITFHSLGKDNFPATVMRSWGWGEVEGVRIRNTRGIVPVYGRKTVKLVLCEPTRGRRRSKSQGRWEMLTDKIWKGMLKKKRKRDKDKQGDLYGSPKLNAAFMSNSLKDTEAWVLVTIATSQEPCDGQIIEWERSSFSLLQPSLLPSSSLVLTSTPLLGSL